MDVAIEWSCNDCGKTTCQFGGHEEDCPKVKQVYNGGI